MKHFRPRLSRRAFWVLCALLVCLRLALTGFQQAYIWVGGAPLDDELMFRAANHITAGQWLGNAEHEKFCANPPGPSGKAKYSRETDSEPVP